MSTTLPGQDVPPELIDALAESTRRGLILRRMSNLDLSYAVGELAGEADFLSLEYDVLAEVMARLKACRETPELLSLRIDMEAGDDDPSDEDIALIVAEGERVMAMLKGEE